VNDAPALKRADIGVAMGITGTDVTKEAAAMTLTDDNFASIVAAVEEGRGVFSNIKKIPSCICSRPNIGEIGLMAGATLLGLPLPLSAVQILYVNLATDGLPALALAVDPPEEDLMKRKPRKPAHWHFYPPGRDTDGARWRLVGAGQPGAVHLGAEFGARIGTGNDDDVRFACVDPVFQSLQLPLRPTLGAAAALCEQMAQPGDHLGTGIACVDRLSALPA
jgi:hypothetical protein